MAATELGGGERVILEARACGMPTEVPRPYAANLFSVPRPSAQNREIPTWKGGTASDPVAPLDLDPRP
eukprot:3747400-Rhodomonas_salina.1